MNTSGNTTVSCAGQGCQPGTIGPVDSCGVIANVGGTLDIDIVVNAIPSVVAGSGAGPNIQGYDMDLIYNPLFVNVQALPANGAGGPPTNLNIQYAGTPGGAHSSTGETPPDSDGDFFMSELDFGVVGESGPGILMRVTMVGVSPGLSTLSVQYTLFGNPDPNIYDNTGSQGVYTITQNLPGTIAVGTTCPAPAGIQSVAGARQEPTFGSRVVYSNEAAVGAESQALPKALPNAGGLPTDNDISTGAMLALLGGVVLLLACAGSVVAGRRRVM